MRVLIVPPCYPFFPALPSSHTSLLLLSRSHHPVATSSLAVLSAAFRAILYSLFTFIVVGSFRVVRALLLLSSQVLSSSISLPGFFVCPATSVVHAVPYCTNQQYCIFHIFLSTFFLLILGMILRAHVFAQSTSCAPKISHCCLSPMAVRLSL